MPVIKPALIYTKQGEVVEVDQKIVEAVDGFSVPDGFVRKGSREQSYMYSLGVYCEETEGVNHKYFCLAGSKGRKTKRAYRGFQRAYTDLQRAYRGTLNTLQRTSVSSVAARYPTENFCDSPPQYPHSSVSSVTVSVPYRELL